jgi:hypothetical protein
MTSVIENGVRAVRRATSDKSKGWNHLVGAWFHLLDGEGKINKQGQIVGCPALGYYVVQFYEWIVGSLGWGAHLVTLEQMHRDDWLLYATNEEMRDAYEHNGRARRTIVDTIVTLGDATAERAHNR